MSDYYNKLIWFDLEEGSKLIKKIAFLVFCNMLISSKI
jgi:hypothetical protein